MFKKLIGLFIQRVKESYDWYWLVFILISSICFYLFFAIYEVTLETKIFPSFFWMSLLFSILSLFRVYVIRKKLLDKNIKFVISYCLIVLSICGLTFTYFSGFLNSHEYSAKETEIFAIHEAGHAIIYENLFPGSVKEARVVSGLQLRVFGQLGMTTAAYVWHDTKLGSCPTVQHMNDLICAKYGGLAAVEEFYTTEKYTGPSNDIEEINKLAKSIIDNGQSGTPLNSEMLTSDERAKITNSIVMPEYLRSKQIIKDNKEHVKNLADQLITRKHLTGDEVRSIVKK